MPQALPLPDHISQTNTYNEVQHNLIEANFGDQYTASAPNGINYIWGKYTIEYFPLSQSDMQTVVAALNAGTTDYLTWQPPDATSSLKWKTLKGTVKVTPASGSYYVVSAQLRQVF